MQWLVVVVVGGSLHTQTHSAHLHESIHRQDHKIRLNLGIVDQVKVHKLLKLNVGGLHALDNVSEHRADIFSQGHCSNDTLYCLLLKLLVRRRQGLFPFSRFTCIGKTRIDTSMGEVGRANTATLLPKEIQVAPRFALPKYLLGIFLWFYCSRI
jgi:hypothetical protein